MGAAILSSVFFLAYFRVQQIQISREDIRIDGATLGHFLSSSYAGKNIFLISKNEITQKVTQAFPEINTLRVQKKYPNTLVIHVSTFPVSFRWSCERTSKSFTIEGDVEKEVTSELYYINSAGLITIPTESEKNAFLIYEKSPCPEVIKRRDQILPASVIDEITKSKNLLESVIGKKIVRAGYYRDGDEIHLIADDETSFWIDFENPFQDQINKLKAAIEMDATLLGAMEHVDLRITGKIFYKPKP